MKIIKYENSALIKSWCADPEEGAIEQAKELAKLPFIFKHVALMPDTHQGYGMPIGGVIACEDVIIPNAVGVDIGCGMSAIKTDVKDVDLTKDTLKELFGKIRTRVPVGFKHHSEKQEWVEGNTLNKSAFLTKELESFSMESLGTLGGGNHFIEFQKDQNGCVWIMVHSGSRNLGYTVAKHYNKIAQELCKKWYSNIPTPKGEDGLAFLPVTTPEGADYITDMNYCLSFAFENRLRMMNVCVEELGKVFKGCATGDLINIHHNYANLENHYGKNVWVHRKGATSARTGEVGIIPGSQGTCSYIVKGLGNPESFMSCSHGAGRKMSRTEAKRTLSLKDEIKKLNDKGVVHNIQNVKDLDEASSAYKDINTVMEEQKNLVSILVKLSPLGVIKG